MTIIVRRMPTFGRMSPVVRARRSMVPSITIRMRLRRSSRMLLRSSPHSPRYRAALPTAAVHFALGHRAVAGDA